MVYLNVGIHTRTLHILYMCVRVHSVTECLCICRVKKKKENEKRKTIIYEKHVV